MYICGSLIGIKLANAKLTGFRILYVNHKLVSPLKQLKELAGNIFPLICDTLYRLGRLT